MILVRMKSTLVQARLGVDDLRDALAQSRRKLEAEQRELLVVRRRKELAVGIKDAETVSVAERFERQHAERVRVLEEKVSVQIREVDLAERELEEMKAELRKAMTGMPASTAGTGSATDTGGAELNDPLVDPAEERAREELDALVRDRARSERDADATRRLEELKRRMGK